MNNIPVFVVSTPTAFRDQLVAFAADPATGNPDPVKVKEFLAKYPESARAIGAIKSHPPSSGFADSTYNSLNAFRFVDAAGNSIPVRSELKIAPVWSIKRKFRRGGAPERATSSRKFPRSA